MILDLDVHVRLGAFELAVALEVGNETVAVVGPNGAGKTTLLRCIAGLVTPVGGHVRLDGRTLDDGASGIHVPPEARRVGVVFQDYLLFPHRSALDNVAFGLRAGGVSRRSARAQARAWLDRAGLGQHAAARPAQLSGGQAQRVALTRTLAPGPRALLLDEPLAAIDVEARQGVRRQLRHHLGDFPGPSLLVTHDAVDAAMLADRLVVLEAGRVVQAGTLDDITRRPRSAWAAGLAGVNLYRGRARGRVVALDGGGQLTGVDTTEGDVFVTIPPAAVALYRSRPVGTPRNIWSATVDDLDTFGDRVRVHLAGSPPVIAEVTPAAIAELDLARGGQVHVAVKATEVTIYPR